MAPLSTNVRHHGDPHNLFFFPFLDVLLCVWPHVRLPDNLTLVKEPVLLKKPQLTSPRHSIPTIFCTIVLYFIYYYIYVKYTLGVYT